MSIVQNASQFSQTPPPLQTGKTHLYEFSLQAGEYIYVRAEQDFLDLKISLLNAEQQPVMTIDSPNGNFGSEHLHYISEEARKYFIAICRGLGSTKNQYRLYSVKRISQTLQDRQHAIASKKFALARGWIQMGEGDHQTQIFTHLQAALSLWQSLGDREQMTHALFELGDRSERDQAIEFFEEALPYFSGTDSPQLAAATYFHLAQRLSERGEGLEKIRMLYEQAIKLNQEAGNQTGAASAMNDLATAMAKMGNLTSCFPLYRDALKIRRSLDDRIEEARIHHNRGKAYLTLGDVEQALVDLQLALDYRKESNDWVGYVNTLDAVGGIYRIQGKLDKALTVQSLALEILEEEQIQDEILRATILNSKGRTLARSGRPHEAMKDHQAALEVFEEKGLRRHQALALYNLGFTSNILKNPEAALNHLGQAQPLFAESQDINKQAQTFLEIARAERSKGNLLAAKRHIERALNFIEDLRSKPVSEKFKISFFAVKQSYSDFYVDLLMELHERQPGAGYDAEAIAASETARARALLDALGSDRKTHTQDPKTKKKIRQIQKDIRRLESERLELLDQPSAGSQLREVENKIHGLEVHLDGLAEHPPQDSGLVELSVSKLLTSPEIQAQLDEDTLLLAYKLGKKRSFLWAVTPKEIHSFVLPKREEIEQAARRTYKLLSSGHRRPVKTALELQSLSDLILKPAAHLLKHQRLLTITDGALQYIPFAALPKPRTTQYVPLADVASFDAASAGADDSNNRPTLIQNHEIINLPSASVAAALRQHLQGRRQAPGLVAVLADPVFAADDPRIRQRQLSTNGPSKASGKSASSRSAIQQNRTFDRLIFSQQEADIILKMVPKDLSFAALDFAVNRTTVAEGPLDDYRIVHFATHGDLNSENPDYSRLILSQFDEQGRKQEDEGNLYAREIYDLKLNAELVVLSACQTALGTEFRGEGLVGLTQGFLYAGAARVLVSLWNIDDQATAEFMRHFYHNLLEEDLPYPTALRQAQLSILQEEKWQAPYFWASFILQGEWN